MSKLGQKYTEIYLYDGKFIYKECEVIEEIGDDGKFKTRLIDNPKVHPGSVFPRDYAGDNPYGFKQVGIVDVNWSSIIIEANRVDEGKAILAAAVRRTTAAKLYVELMTYKYSGSWWQNLKTAIAIRLLGV